MATTVIKSYNSDNQAIVDDTGHLLVSGNVTATNPSVGSTGITAPTSATEIGGVDPTGNLQPVKLDANGNLLTSSSPSGFSSLTPGYPKQVTITGVSSIVLPANSSRKWAAIINNSTDQIFIQYQAPAVINEGFEMNGGSSYTITDSNLWLGDITAISTISSLTITVIEGI